MKNKMQKEMTMEDIFTLAAEVLAKWGKMMDENPVKDNWVYAKRLVMFTLVDTFGLTQKEFTRLDKELEEAFTVEEINPKEGNEIN